MTSGEQKTIANDCHWFNILFLYGLKILKIWEIKNFQLLKIRCNNYYNFKFSFLF